jgi:hypothetical protein
MMTKQAWRHSVPSRPTLPDPEIYQAIQLEKIWDLHLKDNLGGGFVPVGFLQALQTPIQVSSMISYGGQEVTLRILILQAAMRIPGVTVHVQSVSRSFKEMTPQCRLEIQSGRRPEGQVAVQSIRCGNLPQTSLEKKLKSSALSPLVPFLVSARKSNSRLGIALL